MPFYIRKSISAGPFRFNLSKSGVGLSVGVRGLRVGTGPRGHYVHAGRGGLYYRSSLGRAGQRRSPAPLLPTPSSQSTTVYHHPTVEMIEVESAEVLELADSRFQTVLDDLNGRAQQFRLVWAGLAAGLFAWLVSGFSVAGFLLGLVPPAVGAYLDSYRRVSVIFYDLEGDAHAAYLKLVEAFDVLTRCAGKWHVAAGGAVRDFDTWKRNAGAAHLVSKSPTSLEYRLPSVVRSNVTPPAIMVGKQWLYFMPDVILIAHDGRFGAVAYDALQLSYQDSRFIEEGTVPSDAQVVGQTWRFVNKNGGPDRRFNNNRQLPICLYEVIHLRSASGLNELVEFSKTGVAAVFSAAVRELAKALASEVTGAGAAVRLQSPAA